MSATRDGWLAAILNAVFPPRCAGCGWRGVWLCASCAGNLPKLKPPFCRYCGRPTSGVATCTECWKHRPGIEGISSPFFFEGPLRTLIHRFKYRGAKHLAETLARLTLGSAILPESIHLIVPVPLHLRRLRQRGYNQAGLLAAELSAALGIPMNDGCLQRIVDTPPQMSLPAAERRRNVRAAFACANRDLTGRNIMIVDDVCTTGATIDACARAAKRGGAARVTAVTVARAR